MSSTCRDKLLPPAKVIAHNARRGSALILCVALLMMLALIGLALISTARIDRFASAGHTRSVQIDLLSDGMKEVVAGHIAGNPQQEEVWLASRFPTRPDPFVPAEATNPIVWNHLTAPVLAASPQQASEFDSPYVNASGATPVVAHAAAIVQATPSAISIRHTGGSIANYPALKFPDGSTILAADADGDGIADSGLCRIANVGNEGISYYVGVRIVDNNSAINVNTAWSREFDYGQFGAVATKGFYRTNVGLPAHSAEMDLLNLVRAGGSTISLDAGGFSYADQSDALEHGLVSRLDHPDFNGSTPFRAFSLADQAALASRFCVFNPQVSAGFLESVLSQSLVSGTGSNALIPRKRYAPTGAPSDTTIARWYDENFNWELGRRPLRSMLVARNGTSNLVLPLRCSRSDGQIDPLIPSTGGPLPGMAPYILVGANSSGAPLVAKTDINTARFDELWRAFWCVMADNPDPTQPPFPAAPTDPAADGRMFRSPIRNLHPGAGRLSPSMMLQLRAALAAVNAIDLRDSDDDITSREIALYDIPYVPGNPSPRQLPAPTRAARVFGTEKQPFITEVYANTYAGLSNDAKRNPRGYVAIELYNPYRDKLVLRNWALGVIDRRYQGADAKLTIAPLTAGGLPGSAPAGSVAVPSGYGSNKAFLGGREICIPPHGHIVLENLPPEADRAGGVNPADAQYRPATVSTTPQIETISVYVPNLTDVINGIATTGGELVLLRPHRADSLGKSDVAGNVYHEGTEANPALADFVPVDSYDFTGLESTPNDRKVLHYVRENGDAGQHAWKFVYPGLMLPTPFAPGVPFSRHMGVQIDAEEPADCRLGDFDDHCSEFAASSKRVAPWPAVQLINDDMAGFNKGVAKFPFGAFARNGDLLQVPFIGGYQIRDLNQAASDASFAEMNSVTMDCSFVDDQARDPATNRRVADSVGTSDDPHEQLGRFCPIQLPRSALGDPIIDDYDLHGSYNPTLVIGIDDAGVEPPPQSCWRYHFATRLFDYLTVHSPASDRRPNVDPDPEKYAMLGIATQPPPVANSTARAADPYNNKNPTAEHAIGVEGLININTAPWWVIASLPLLPNDLAGDDSNKNGFPDFNEMLAKQIVAWRDGDAEHAAHGPFRSIFDLNRIDGSDPAGAITPLGFPSNSLPESLQHKIPPFADAIRFYATHLRAGYSDPGQTDGDVAPNEPGKTDGVHEIGKPDFEERFLMLDRISNLITTRSDTFTAYIILQGWRNAETATPELVVQRRVGMIIDRNGTMAARGAPKVTAVPGD